MSESPQVSVIWGPPGTGKTSTLSKWTQRAAARYGAEKIVICSLTRAGAREIASRVEIPEQHVGTIHKLAYHGLGFPEIAEGKIKEWNETYPAWARDKGRSFDHPYDVQRTRERAEKDGDELAQELSRLRTMDVPPEAWGAELQAYSAAWDDWKEQCGYVDFVDLLHMALTDMDTAPGNPTVVMVDEAQDFGPLEMRLVMKWAQSAKHLVLAGDSHQSIFSWRGSTPAVILDRINAGNRLRVLDQSYRVPQAMHRLALRWMKLTGIQAVKYNPRRADLCVRCQTPTEPRPGEVWDGFCPRCGVLTCGTGKIFRGDVPHNDAENLVPLLHALTGQGKRVMLICTCNYMVDDILRVLQKAGVPYHNPWRPENGRWNPLATRKNAVSLRERVLSFSHASERIWGDEAKFWTVKELRAWAKVLPAKDIFVYGQKGVVERLKEEMKDTELSQAMREWFTAEALEKIYKVDLDWYLDKADAGGTIGKQYITNIVSQRGVDGLTQTPQVIVGTVHSLKGSEAEVVMVWPDIAPAAYYSEDKAVHEELARVFYVAVTRAQELLYLMSPGGGCCVGW